MPRKIAEENKKIRRESLREELKSREYLRQIHKILDTKDDDLNTQTAKLKLDGYFKLLAKTLPDTKAIELTGEDGNPIKTDNTWKVEIVDAETDSTK